jgi:hypothetical protein
MEGHNPPPPHPSHGEDVMDSTDTSKLPPWHPPCPPGYHVHHVAHASHGNGDAATSATNPFVFTTGLRVKNSLTRTKVPFITMTGTNHLTWYMYVYIFKHFAKGPLQTIVSRREDSSDLWCAFSISHHLCFLSLSIYIYALSLSIHILSTSLSTSLSFST